jgi:23S rRNA G2445 N2-methylase RlmL
VKNDSLSSYDCFAVAAPGLESLVEAELSALGETPVAEDGGVAWNGDAASLCRANIWLRTASRVLVRAGEFRARTFFELERHARKVPWERFLAPAHPMRLRVTCRKSRLYHSDAVAQRLAQAIEYRLAAASAYTATDSATDDDGEEQEPEQLFVVRLLRDECTVSADSSGALLHMRGYRQAVAKAPLRETLAAALLLAAAAAWFLARKQWSLGAYALLSLLLPLSAGSLQSIARYAAVVFPLHVALAFLGRRAFADRAIVAVSVMLFGWLTALLTLRVDFALA